MAFLNTSQTIVHHGRRSFSLCDQSSPRDSRETIVQEIRDRINQIDDETQRKRQKITQMRQRISSRDSSIREIIKSLGFSNPALFSNIPKDSTINPSNKDLTTPNITIPINSSSKGISSMSKSNPINTMNVNLLKDAVEKLEVRKKQAQAELDILLSGDELYKSKEIEADVINLYEEYQRLSTEIVKSNDYMNVVLKDIECATNIIKDSKMEEKETIKINKEVEELRLQINQQKINKQKLSDESSSLKKESIITEIENLESTLNAEKVSAIKSEEIEKQSSIDLNDTITFAVLRLQETMKEINKEKNSQK